MAQLGLRVRTLGTGLLLLVEGAIAAATTQSVCLGVALTETGGTFGLVYEEKAIRVWMDM